MRRKIVLVAVVGGSGSGKTWLCEKLRAVLGGQATRLSLDDFYRDRSHLSMSQRARINFDHPRAIDWPAFERVLKDCLSGKQVMSPRYDFKTHTRLNRPRRFRPKPVIFVDGLWLLHRAQLRACFSLSIFLHCSTKIRLERRIARDLLKRGRTIASVRKQFREMVEPMHRLYVEPQARWADLVVSKPPNRSKIAELAALLQKRTIMINSTP